jgi:cellulose biosynthesis protein BcsQ
LAVTSGALPLADTSMLDAIVPAMTQRVRRKVLVIANGKGGVGKSSLAAALAVVLTKIGKKVLLIELDPQGNNAEDLGFIGTELYDNGEEQARAILTGTAFKPTGEARPGLWVVPGGEALEQVTEELYIQRRMARDTGGSSWLYMYANSIAQAEDGVDLIILDVAPGSLVLQTQAMVAGDMVLVPSRSDESSRKGLRVIARRYVEAKPHNPSLTLIGIVLFGVTSGGARITKTIRDHLERDVRGSAPVVESVIRYVESVAVACRQLGLVPDELAREKGIDTSTATSARRLAGDYRSLATEVLTIIAQLHQADAA